VAWDHGPIRQTHVLRTGTSGKYRYFEFYMSGDTWERKFKESLKNATRRIERERCDI